MDHVLVRLDSWDQRLPQKFTPGKHATHNSAFKTLNHPSSLEYVAVTQPCFYLLIDSESVNNLKLQPELLKQLL
jgi:hypothetical protein